MRTAISGSPSQDITSFVGMKPLSERDENSSSVRDATHALASRVGMKPLSERDENIKKRECSPLFTEIL